MAWNGLGSFLHLEAPQAAPWSSTPLKHITTDAPSIPESLSSNTDRHEISQALTDELLLCTNGKLRLKVRCLLGRFPPSPPCNAYVKLDCAAGGSRAPWDHLKLIILSEGGSPWIKEKKVSLRQMQSLGGVLRFCMQSSIIWEGFPCTWHRLEQVEKTPCNFIIHFNGSVSP